jgi:hypothetical protein
MARVTETVLQVVVGTPVYTMYLRLMGASIGYNAQIYTSFVTEFDLISIGRNCRIEKVRKKMNQARLENNFLFPISLLLQFCNGFPFFNNMAYLSLFSLFIFRTSCFLGTVLSVATL